MEVKGKSVTIHAEGEGQTDVRAIHVATNALKPSQRSSLLIDADTVSITADGEGARAIVAMSTGVVEVKGKATIAADNAIVARGDAKVLVNAEKGSTRPSSTATSTSATTLRPPRRQSTPR